MYEFPRVVGPAVPRRLRRGTVSFIMNTALLNSEHMVPSPLDCSPLSVVCLAHNEVESIGAVVQGLHAAGVTNVMVVDDGSDDGTAEAAARAHALVMSHGQNCGYGAAVRSALDYAPTPWICLLDGDGQFSPSAVMALWAAHLRNPTVDAVWGIRSQRADPLIRRLTGRAWHLANTLLLGIPVSDVDCGAKLIRVSAVPTGLRSSGAGISAELCVALIRAGGTIEECPVEHLPRVAGKASGLRPAVLMQAFVELLDIARRYGDGPSILRRILRFVLAGAANTLVDLGLYALALLTVSGLCGVRAAPWLVALLALITYGAGGILGWLLSRRWTFPSRMGHGWRFAVQVGGFGVANAALTWGLAIALARGNVGMALVAKTVALGITAVASFLQYAMPH